MSTKTSSVHAADYSLHRPGLRVLEERCGGARPAEVLIENSRIECARKKAAVVAERLRGQDENVGKVCRLDAHKEMLS
jgi:hypothetical protein